MTISARTTDRRSGRDKLRPGAGLPAAAALIAALALALCPTTSARAAGTLTVVVPSPCPGPVGFGADEIARSAKLLGWQVQRQSGGTAAESPAVRIAIWSRADASRLPAHPAARAESYSIVKAGRAVTVVGSDATGAMYGALYVSEQMRWSGNRAHPLAAVKTRSRSPYLKIRGVNQFIHRQALDDPNSWFYSDAFWQAYLDALARSRHNFLDLHCLYDLMTTGFPNMFPYFIHLDEYPKADIGAGKTRKNLAMLRRIVEMAADRGIKVGLMNYNAPADVPKGKLADYTAKCVDKLLRALPGLWAFGFRIGESGQPADFFKHAYIEGVRLSGRHPVLYTRSWLANRSQVMGIADAYHGRFLVEPKYNGEHLGLPYQVQGERMAGWGSYSYQAYTDLPHSYGILWQIRAGGTHRLFQWGDPEVGRRVARSCRLGHGVGFSLEAMTSYCPMGEYYLNPKTFPHPFFKWEFQRDWMWYSVWGRTGYDPTVPDSVFVNLFRDRYGDKAGPALYRATVAASRIVPMIYSYHCLGPDSRNMEPEFETGDGFTGGRRADGTGVRIHAGIAGFLAVEPLDDTAMESPRSYVDRTLKGEAHLAFGPADAARYLDDAAADALRDEAAAGAGEVPASARDRALDLDLDVQALAALARYYAAKIEAVTELDFFNRTGNLAALREARGLLAQAIGQWGKLSDVTEKHFTPINERLRMFTDRFTWREEGKDLPKQLTELDAMEAKAKASPAPGAAASAPAPKIALLAPSSNPGVPEVTTASAKMSVDRKTARVTATLHHAANAATVTLYYRPMPSFYLWEQTPMKRQGPSTYTATVPLTPEGLLWRITASDKAGRSSQWPDFLLATPYRRIDPWAPRWVKYDGFELPEGTPTYHPRVGEKVFPDSDEVITKIPPELANFVGVRYPQSMLKRAQGQGYGGFPIHFRAIRTVRLLVTWPGGPPPASYGRYAAQALTVGDTTYDIYGRDFPPGDHTFAFASGPIGIILGFKALAAGDPKLTEPTEELGGVRSWGLAKRGFVTTFPDTPFYSPTIGKRVYTDRNYVVQRIPKELETCIGVRFSNDTGKAGRFVFPFRLARPATLYVVFGNPDEGAWQRPMPGWRLYAKNAYQQGPGDDTPRSIYCKNFPAGESAVKFPQGTLVILGFK